MPNSFIASNILWGGFFIYIYGVDSKLDPNQYTFLWLVLGVSSLALAIFCLIKKDFEE